MKYYILSLCLYLFSCTQIQAQNTETKADHAEPLVNDFTTDLASDKGTFEGNFVLDFAALEKKYNLQPHIELEYALFKNFGIEVEVPFSFSKRKGSGEKLETRLPSLEWSAQYTVFSKPESNSTLAISYNNGYSFKENKKGLALEQISHSPFLLYAKSLQNRYYFTGNAGPEIIQKLDTSAVEFNFQFGGSFHYKFKQINYIGFEYAQDVNSEESEVMFYPEYFCEFTDMFTAGGAVGIPLTNFDTRFSALIRISKKM